MKTIFTFFIVGIINIVLAPAHAQYTQNFEGNVASLTGNCWSLSEVYQTTSAGDVITGTGSMYTNPPTTSTATRDIFTPALDVNSTSLTIAFDYKVSSKINGQATRTIEVGLVDVNNIFTSLSMIKLDKTTTTSVLNFNQTFTLASTGLRRVVLRLGGSTGDGNSRLIFDNFYVSASTHYGPASTCNSAPIAVNDVYLGTAGLPFSSNLMANDNEPNGELMTSAVVISSPDGTVILQPDGYFTFTPAPGFTGTSTTFTYQLTDNGMAPATSNIATVTINFSSAMILPVTFLNFEASYTSPAAILSWTTSKENNLDHFEIEMSADGRNFQTIGNVNADGDHAAKKDYSYTQPNVANQNAVIYYRLKSVDKNGQATYTTVKKLLLQSAGMKASITVYPNPVVTGMQITMPANWANKSVSIRIVNANGQQMLEASKTVNGGKELISMSQFTKGIYMVIVTCNNESAIQKIIKY